MLNFYQINFNEHNKLITETFEAKNGNEYVDYFPNIHKNSFNLKKKTQCCLVNFWHLKTTILSQYDNSKNYPTLRQKGKTN